MSLVTRQLGRQFSGSTETGEHRRIQRASENEATVKLQTLDQFSLHQKISDQKLTSFGPTYFREFAILSIIS